MTLQRRNFVPAVVMIASMVLLTGCGEPDGSRIASIPTEPPPSASNAETPAPGEDATYALTVVDESTPENADGIEAEPAPTLVSENVVPMTVQPAIDYITLEELQKTISLRHNKPLFVYFWACWCSPCIEEIPSIVELYKKYGNQIDFLAVSCDSFYGTVNQVPSAMKTLTMAFATRVLKAENQHQAFAELDPSWQGALPKTFVYNIKGETVKTFLGKQSPEIFESALKEALAGVEKVRFPSH